MMCQQFISGEVKIIVSGLNSYSHQDTSLHKQLPTTENCLACTWYSAITLHNFITLEIRRKYSSTDSEHTCNHRAARGSVRTLFTTVFCANDRIKSSKHKQQTVCRSPAIRYFTCTTIQNSAVREKFIYYYNYYLIIIEKYGTFKKKAKFFKRENRKTNFWPIANSFHFQMLPESLRISSVSFLCQA